MSSLNIKNLKDNNLIFYIYQVDLSLFGIPDDHPKFIIVADKEFVNNNDLDEDEFPWIYSTEEWFDLVSRGELLPWICACMNKKFIHKEFVKLVMTTNPIQLRKLIEQEIDDALNHWEAQTKEALFFIIALTMFAVQIIENHKIVNFSSPKKYYNLITDDMTAEEFLELLYPEKEILCKLTDGIIHKAKVAKALAKIEAAEKAALENPQEENQEEKEETNEI